MSASSFISQILGLFEHTLVIGMNRRYYTINATVFPEIGASSELDVLLNENVGSTSYLRSKLSRIRLREKARGKGDSCVDSTIATVEPCSLLK